MLFVRAPCKINLTLDVFDGRERTDGFHSLDSLVVPLSQPSDELRICIEPAEQHSSVTLTCNDSRLPLDERNLAHRAATTYLAQIDKPFHIEIDLYKRVPAEAGLGGGSSDAAAVLRALNTFFHQTVKHETLVAMAARLGSDIPLFLAQKPVRMRDCGETVEPLDVDLPSLWGVLVKPATGVPTAGAYALLDAVPDRQPGTSTERLLSLLGNTDATAANMVELLATSLSDDFEPVVLAAYPAVRDAHTRVKAAGALRALLCGSGSAIFGLARNAQHATQMAEVLKPTFPFVSVTTAASADTFTVQLL